MKRRTGLRIALISGWLFVCAWVILFRGSSGVRAQSVQNPVQIENANPGSSAWNLDNNSPGPSTKYQISGYASANSINRGESISFYVSTTDPSYTIQIFRMGYYGGMGGRAITQPVTLTGMSQPVPTPDPTYGMVECNWTSQYTLTTTNTDPTQWVSGFYLAILTGTKSGYQWSVPFVVRDDSRVSNILFNVSMNTYEAYNSWPSKPGAGDGTVAAGPGKSLYTYNSSTSIPQAQASPGAGLNSAVKVSFNRPFDDSNGGGEFLDFDFDMISWLEQQGYDVTYQADIDTTLNASALLQHKGIMFGGHDEYWDLQQRENVTAALADGINLGFFGANTIYWQTRYEPSPITSVANRTLVGWKEDTANDPDRQNPATYALVSDLYRNARPGGAPQPEDALVGVMFDLQPVNTDIVVVDASNWVFANSGLTNGSHLTGLLGYEEDQEFGDQPANTVDLAHSPYTVDGTGQTGYSDMTVYQAPSGAWVFAVGSIQWDWGLSNIDPWGPTDSNQNPISLVNPAAQQITENVLNEFIASGPNSTPSTTPTSTATTGQTATPTMTPTARSTVTATLTPSTTPTPTPTVTTSQTATPTPTAIGLTPTPTATLAAPTATPTASATPTFTLVAGVSASTSTSAVTSLSTNTWKPAAGDSLGVFVEIASTSVSVNSITDTLGNTYSKASGITGSTGRVELWYSIGIKGGSSNAVTVTFSNTTKAVVRGEEFAGVPLNATLQTTNTNAGAAPGTNATTGSLTTTAGPSYLVADIGWDSAATASATQGGFARIGQLSDGDSTATVSYLFVIASNPGSFGTGVTLSTSSNWQGVLAAFAAGASPTPTPSTPTPIATLGPTATSSATSTATATATGTPTNTPTSTPSPTGTPADTATATASPTGTSTATASASPTGTPTNTPTASESPTNTATASPTGTPTAAPTATASPTGTSTATASASPTGTPTNTPTASESPTNTATASPTGTPTAAPTATASATGSPTSTVTSTSTPSPSSTLSATPTPSMTPQPSTGATATATSLPTPTPTASAIATPSPTGATATPTPTPVFALVAGFSGTTTGAATVTTSTWKPGAGNTIGVFVEIASTSVSVSAVSDGLGNSYSFASGLTGTNGRVELWYSIGIKGGSSDSITATLTGSAGAAVRGEEFSGVPVTATLQQTNTNAGVAAGTNATTGNVTTTAPSYLIADIGWNSAAAASATQGGFSRIGQVSNSNSSATICYMFAQASAPGTFGTGVTLSTSSNWQGVLAAFR